MSRQLLDETLIHPSIQSRIGGRFNDTLNEVKQAVSNNPILIVGMAQNPNCKNARKTLDKTTINYQYLEYGSYFKEWQRRLVLKMWTGWPTFPMVFVNGQLVGGANELKALHASGELNNLLK